MNPTNPHPVPPATLFAGEHVDVTFRDGAGVRVFVREITPDQLGDYLAAYGNMVRLVQLCCEAKLPNDHPYGPDWANWLQPDSLFSLSDKVAALNDPTFGPWLERQGPRLQRLAGNMGSPLLGSASAARSR